MSKIALALEFAGSFGAVASRSWTKVRMSRNCTAGPQRSKFKSCCKQRAQSRHFFQTIVPHAPGRALLKTVIDESKHAVGGCHDGTKVSPARRLQRIRP